MKWYKVVTFGSPTEHTISILGNPNRKGRTVSKNLDDCLKKFNALKGHVSCVRIIECPTRAEALEADISDGYDVIRSS